MLNLRYDRRKHPGRPPTAPPPPYGSSRVARRALPPAVAQRATHVSSAGSSQVVIQFAHKSWPCWW